MITQSGVMEECVLIDQKALNEIIIPTTNVVRRLPNGEYVNEETVNRSQVYITTAGWKDSFAYKRLIEILIDSILDEDNFMILGGTYEIPVKEGLLEKNFVNQLKLQGTFSEESFGREYCSLWSGGVEGAFFSSERFDQLRTLELPEKEYSGHSSRNAYYVFGIDVGRSKCTTEVAIFKVTPQSFGNAMKSLVNLYTYEAEHFAEQSIKIKQLYYKFKPRAIAVDAQGVGFGFVDMLTTQQVDDVTGEIYPAFGVAGGTYDDAKSQYKDIKGGNVEENVLYLIKANPAINSEAYGYAQTQLINGKIKMLIDEQKAKSKLDATKAGAAMSYAQRAEYLTPFINTSIFKTQMLNLVQTNDGSNIVLKPSSKGIKHDKFSAFIYGLYYIKQEEEKGNKRKNWSVTDYLYYN